VCRSKPDRAASDVGWSFDGTTLKFSREVPTAAPDKPMPLVLQVKTQAVW
jgi:hypothetical protein